jgi:RHS repeat-associated protein/uncharacterized repeat protein (TIGR01451 family)
VGHGLAIALGDVLKNRIWLRSALAATISISLTALPSTPSWADVPGAGNDPDPVLGGQIFATGTAVSIEVLDASAGLTSVLSLYEPEIKRIATNRDVGTKVTVGPYEAGTELVFGINANGSIFRMGPTERNPDGQLHATVDFDSTGCAVVGFEDLFGGGDRDYNDNMFRFCGGISADPEPTDPGDPEPNDPIEPPVADAGPDQAVDEGAVVNLDGSGSAASKLPSLSESSKTATLPSGAALAVKIKGMAEGSSTKLAGEIDLGLPDASATSTARVTSATIAIDGGVPQDISVSVGLPKGAPSKIGVSYSLPASALTGDAHTVCLSATGEDSNGPVVVAACSDLVRISGELSYNWRIVSSDGPPVLLSQSTSPKPSFVASDDGRYVVEVTVTDRSGGTASDRTVVKVNNLAPKLTVSSGDAYAGGVTQVNATLTDAGWLDTHTAIFDWGDGATSQVKVQAGGAGWGSFFGSHVYREPGTYKVRVTTTDDDKGSAEASVPALVVQEPVAVWANSTSRSESFEWTGGPGEIDGRIHSNGQVKILGSLKSVGQVTYAGELRTVPSLVSFGTSPQKVAVQQIPAQPQVADFRPDGRVAKELGAAYHDVSSECSKGSHGMWKGSKAPLSPGVYYASCDIKLSGSQLSGKVTLVSEKSIDLSGCKPAFTAYLDGLLFLSGSSGNAAIRISASGSKFLGSLVAEHGEVKISGSTNQFFCSIIGDRVDLSGSHLTLRGGDCGRGESAASPVLVPNLVSSIAADQTDAGPGQPVNYDLTVTNQGSTLVVSALIGLENTDSSALTVDSWTQVVERQDASTGAWEPLLPNDQVRLSTSPNDFTGVAYSTSAARVVGTTMQPGGWATWGTQALLQLDADQTRRLLDSTRTSGVRVRVAFGVSPNSVQMRTLFTYGRNFISDLRALSATASNAQAQLILPDDATTLTSSDDAALANIGPGETVTIRRGWTVPVPLGRGSAETDAGYLARLLAQDRTPLNAAAFVTASSSIGKVIAPLSHTATLRHLPVVGVSTTGASEIASGASAEYSIKLANLGSSSATGVATTAFAGKTALDVVDSPTSLAAGELGAAKTVYAAPAAATGDIKVRAATTWADERGNTYGATGSSLTVSRQAPAAIKATLADELHTDIGSDGYANAGDTLRYTLAIYNDGDTSLVNPTATVDVDANLALVTGSATTPDGGSVSISGHTVTVSVPDIAGHSRRSVTFDAKVSDPFPQGVSSVSSQGTAAAAGLDPVKTDDPARSGVADATVTNIVVPSPALAAYLTGALAVDADHDGVVSAGDTLAYTATVNSYGTKTVTDAAFELTLPDGLALVEGSVSPTTGTVATAQSLKVAIGSLAPQASEKISFRAKIANPLPVGVATLAAQGTVTSAELSPQLTDDPTTPPYRDATVINVDSGQSANLTPGPTVSSLSVNDGDRITVPTKLTATLTPPAGAQVTGWTITMTSPGGATPQSLATGTTATASATLDPTTIPNGLYVVTLTSTSSDGGTTTTTLGVQVDGSFKPGRFTTSYADHEVALGGLPLQVVRRYDSFNTSQGDFGIGWNVGVANFRVSTARQLGATGWEGKAYGCALTFCKIEYTSSLPHFVTITWPDGHQEAFDLVGADGSTFMTGLARAKFVAREGTNTTSTLEVDGDNGLYFPGDGNAYGGAFGNGGIFDPTSFRLTDTNGTVYVIDRSAGLKSITDANGDTLTFTKDGVSSSLGKSITYTRDDAGRITKIDSPAGSTSYTYDPAGNLATSTALDATVTSYSYDASHNLTGMSGPGGKALGSMEYDADGRLVAFVDSAGHRTKIETDLSSRQEKITDPTGKLLTISSYNTQGDLTREDAIADGKTRTTSWTYDSHGQVLTATDVTGTVKVTRDDQGRVLTATDQQGRATAFTYDDAGRLVKQVDPTGATTTWTRDARGNVTATQTPDGVTTEYALAKGLVTKVTRAGQLVSSYEYNGLGLVTSATAATGEVRKLAYDDAGRLTKVSDGGDAVIREIAYDAKGRPVRMANATGQVRSWTWGSLGQLLTQTDEGGRTTTYGYDDARRLTSLTDRNNETTAFTYDAAGRVLTSRSPEGTNAYTYDGFGELTSANNATAELSFGYDAAGRLTSESVGGSHSANYALSYSYNPDGTVKRLTTPWATTNVGYGQAGQLATVADSQAGSFSYTIDDAGRLAKMTRPNGVTLTAGYGADGYLSSLTNAKGTTSVSAESVVRDATGRVTSVADQAGTTSYGFDSLGNLTSVDYPTSAAFADETFTYDKAGNRTGWNNNPASSVRYDSSGRLVADATYDYGYDGEGNLIARTERATAKVTRYEWNVDHTLKAVTAADGVITRYGYDALGRRMSRTVDATTTTWAYDGAYLIGEYAGAGGSAALTRSFTLDPLTGDPLAATTASGTTTYPILDRLGSTTAVTNAAGEVVSRTSYSAFGQAHTEAAAAGLFDGYTYTGHASDEGLIYARARWYDPTIGRFLSEDPVLGANLYAYVNNDPINYTDPTGAMAATEYGIVSSGDDERAEAAAAPSATESSAGKYLFDSWYRSTFDNRLQSILYHLAKHGGGRDALTYTRDAMEFFAKYRSLGVGTTLRDGTAGIKIAMKLVLSDGSVAKVGGIWTVGGQLVTFWG